MSRTVPAPRARLGVLAAALAALALAGCSSTPAPTPEPAAPSVAPSAAPVVTEAPAEPAASAPASAAPAASDSAALPPEPAAPVLVAASPAASGAVAREAGAFSRGTATCILNGSSDRLTIRIENADTDQAEYTNTNGTEAFPSATWRCMKGDASTASGAPIATITIASGESFTVRSYNPPFGGCAPWVAVNGDSRCIEAIGGTTAFKIGKHPITAKRMADTGSFNDGGWIVFEVRIAG